MSLHSLFLWPVSSAQCLPLPGWKAAMPDHPDLQTALKHYRQAAGLTQADLAAKVSVSRKTINTIENGVFVPTTVLALRLARVLDCRVEDLFSLRD